VLTPAGTFIAPGIQWLVNHFAALPANLKIATVWEAPGWLYLLCFVGCFAVVQIFGWVDQYKKVMELTGRPGVVAQMDGERIKVENTNEHVAMEVTALEIVFEIEDQQLAESSTKSVNEDGDISWPRHWFFSFFTVDSLVQGSPSYLNCRITPNPLGNVGIAGCMSYICKNGFPVEFPLTILFFNVGPPKRQWHAHFKMLQRPARQVEIKHKGTGEVHKNGRCSVCDEPDPKRHVKTLLGTTRTLSLGSTTHAN
jgi:hypothetical protein